MTGDCGWGAARGLLEGGIAVAAYDLQRIGADHPLAAVAAAGNDGRHHDRAELTYQEPAARASL